MRGFVLESSTREIGDSHEQLVASRSSQPAIVRNTSIAAMNGVISG
jgi:hypothetical protein